MCYSSVHSTVIIFSHHKFIYPNETLKYLREYLYSYLYHFFFFKKAPSCEKYFYFILAVQISTTQVLCGNFFPSGGFNLQTKRDTNQLRKQTQYCL